MNIFVLTDDAVFARAIALELSDMRDIHINPEDCTISESVVLTDKRENFIAKKQIYLSRPVDVQALRAALAELTVPRLRIVGNEAAYGERSVHLTRTERATLSALLDGGSISDSAPAMRVCMTRIRAKLKNLSSTLDVKCRNGEYTM